MPTTNLIWQARRLWWLRLVWQGRGYAGPGPGGAGNFCEVDAVRANEALMDGYDVMPLQKAAARGDFFITVTGNHGVLRREHFAVMKDGAILANAGHFDVEISKPGLLELTQEVREARANVTEYHLKDGRSLFLLGEGRLVNLAAGDGHPAEIMDMSFALQALPPRYLVGVW